MGALLEREVELVLLDQAVTDAADGRGSAVLLSGEAGIGKTAVARAFADRVAARAHVLLGACDDLITPRTLGPIRDVAHGAGPLATALTGGLDHDAVFAALTAELSNPVQPTVLIVEDVHWADDATLDLLRLLARRIEDLPAVLLLTYRDGELAGDHPLARVLAAYVAPRVRRLALRPLSSGAVQRLATGTGADAAAVTAATGGNPFFVTEVLAAGLDELPATVAQAVMARVSRLGSPTRDVLSLVSVVPAATETWLLDACAPSWTTALEPAEQAGIVAVHDDTVAFRHELARRAVERSLAETRRRRLHSSVLSALLGGGGDAARLVHHAVGAAATEAIVTHAPVAARQAAGASAYREAAAHYRRALAHRERYPVEEQAALLEGLSLACFTVYRPQEALETGRAAVAGYRKVGDPLSTGRALASLSRVASFAGATAEATLAATEAVALLEPLARTPQLARAYAALGFLALVAWDLPEAARWIPPALEVADALGDHETCALALVLQGAYEVGVTGDDGPLREAVDAARQGGHRVHAGEGYLCATTILHFRRAYRREAAWIEEGLAETADWDLVSVNCYLHAVRALLRLDQGAWHLVEVDVQAALAGEATSTLSQVLALTARGRLQARRGDPAARATLHAAWAVSTEQATFQPRYVVAAALAELAWLDGDRGVPPEVMALRDSELGQRFNAALGELAVWSSRLSDPWRPAAQVAEPYRLRLAGRYEDAAAAWHRIGCPYEQAECLVESGDARLMRQGLEVLEALGALPLADRTRARLRAMGERALPRRPTEATRANPAGLTARQSEILALLGEGLTNAEIADRLVVSVRTVDHHVSAVLARLGVPTRRDAAEQAVGLGLVR